MECTKNINDSSEILCKGCAELFENNVIGDNVIHIISL